MFCTQHSQSLELRGEVVYTIPKREHELNDVSIASSDKIRRIEGSDLNLRW